MFVPESLENKPKEELEKLIDYALNKVIPTISEIALYKIVVDRKTKNNLGTYVETTYRIHLVFKNRDLPLGYIPELDPDSENEY